MGASDSHPQVHHMELGEVMDVMDFIGREAHALESVGTGAAGISTPTVPRQQRRSEGGATQFMRADMLSEIMYLRTIIADNTEETSIQAAIHRDELAEKQRTIDALTVQVADMERMLKAVQEGPTASAAWVAEYRARWQEQQEAYEQQQQSLDRQKNDLERMAEQVREDMEDLQSRVQQAETEVVLQRTELESAREENRNLEDSNTTMERDLRECRKRLSWWSPDDLSLGEAQEESEVVQWESDLRQASEESLKRLTDRRVKICVAAATATETSLCKICYDRPVSCALLPCKHHAFCSTCANRVKNSRPALCPICRARVTKLFETFTT